MKQQLDSVTFSGAVVFCLLHCDSWTIASNSLVSTCYWNILGMDICGFIWLACLQWLLFCELASAVLKDLPDNPRLTYTRDYLMQLGLQPHHIVFTDSFPEEILRVDSSNQYNSICSRTKVNRRGKKKGGVRARLKRETRKQRALRLLLWPMCALSVIKRMNCKPVFIICMNTELLLFLHSLKRG